ncbi:MAG: hypothetical protein WCV67_03175 [Victivallaceae bacterium]|jgi:hypothetical protein
MPPLEHVNPGQKLRIPAATFNSMVDAAKDFEARQSRTGGGAKTYRSINPAFVLLSNPDGGSFERFRAAALAAPAIPPDDREEGGGLGVFFDAPNFAAALPAGTLTEQIAVLDEPSGAGDTATLSRAVVAGCCPCRIKVTDETAQYARTDAGQTYLVTAAAGQFRILWKEADDAPDGLRWAYGIVNAVPAEPGYTGYFKGVDVSTIAGMKISVIDGYSADEELCGYVYIDQYYPVYKTDLNVTMSGYAVLTIDTTDGEIVKTVTFEHSFDFNAAPQPDTLSIPLLFVLVNTEGTEPFIQEIQQLQHGIPFLYLLKFPSLVQDYDEEKILVMVMDHGVYKWVEAGSCDESPSA